MPFIIRRFLLALGACIIWTLVAATSQSARAEGERLALLIGNSRYEHATPLRNPENDVELIATSLKSAGFETFVGKNASHQEMSRLLDSFIGAARSKNRPTLLVYFAGHGVQLADINYLIPVDAKTSSADELQQHSLSATKLLQRLLTVDPGLAMLVLDACRDNPFETASRSLRRGLGDLDLVAGGTNRAGQLIAFATAPGTTADDGDAGNSPYASALAESIIEPGLPLEGVFREVRRKVVDRTKGQQQPWERVSLFSEFYFIPPASKPKPPTEEATFWDLASIVNSAEIYQRYLDRFPQGTFAELARRKIAAINSDFSYRRKAELFPILQVTRTSFANCADKNDYRLASGLRAKFEELNGQIIYVRLVIPVTWLYCRDKDGKVSYDTFKFIRDSKNNCGLFFFDSEGIYSNRTSCVTASDVNIVPSVDDGRVFADGGLAIGTNDDSLILLPAGQTDFYSFDFEYAEAIIEEMYAEFSGLVRVKNAKQEYHLTTVLEPVDPKTLGVSWKFDNTVAAAKSLPDTALMGPIPYVESAAQSAPNEATFSVLHNRAMSGHDIRHTKGTDEATCASQCRSEPRCRAYLYDKWNRWCFLKSALAEIRIDPKYNFGLPGNVSPPALSARPREIIYYRGKQFPDAGAFHAATDYRACAQQCLSLPHCVAFTFDRQPRSPAPCKIMGAVGEYFSKAGADSGVARQSP